MGILSSDVSDIKIIFDPNPGRPYLQGEVISGKAILVTGKDGVKVQKATIKVSGQVSIHMIEVNCVFSFKIYSFVSRICNQFILIINLDL